MNEDNLFRCEVCGAEPATMFRTEIRAHASTNALTIYEETGGLCLRCLANLKNAIRAALTPKEKT